MAFNYRSLSCCGCKELTIVNQFATLEPALAALSTFVKEYSSTIGFLILTEVVNHKPNIAAQLLEYIKENDLGDVVSTDRGNNPNSGNTLRVHVWYMKNKTHFNRWKPLGWADPLSVKATGV